MQTTHSSRQQTTHSARYNTQGRQPQTTREYSHNYKGKTKETKDDLHNQQCRFESTDGKRRWRWTVMNNDKNNTPDDEGRPETPDQDYSLSSVENTSGEDSSLAYFHARLQRTESHSYNRYSSHRSTLRSGQRPSPPRARSLGPVSRTQSLSSGHDSGYGVISRGSSLNLHHPRWGISGSLQDIQRIARGARNIKAGLEDITITDSEIDKV